MAAAVTESWRKSATCTTHLSEFESETESESFNLKSVPINITSSFLYRVTMCKLWRLVDCLVRTQQPSAR